MPSGRGRFRTQSRQQPAQSPPRPDLAAIVQQLLIAAAEGRVSGGPQVRRPCQAGQVEGSGLGDCHRVAPLLPRALICPACAGLRAKKAEDYLRCTSTPATHWLLAAQQRSHTGASAPLRVKTCTFIDLTASVNLRNHINECLSKVHEWKLVLFFFFARSSVTGR